MLYRLCFRTHDLTLPLSYHHAVQGLLYHLMRSAPDYSGFLHDSGYDAGQGARFKLFCFGLLRGTHHRRGRSICFPDHASLSVRTADPMLGAVLDETLRPGLRCALLHQDIVLEEVERESLHLTGSELTIRMDSPIAVHHPLPGGKTRPVSPEEAAFSRLVNENYRRKWSIISGAPAEDEVALEPLRVSERDKCVTRIRNTWVTAWGGTYRLTGSPRALEFLYHTGLGSRSSAGFGLFDIV